MSTGRSTTIHTPRQIAWSAAVAVPLMLLLTNVATAQDGGMELRAIEANEVEVEMSETASMTDRNGRRYRAAALMDTRDWSAWATQDRRGAWVRVTLGSTRYITAIRLVVGNAADPKVWASSSRPTKVEILWDGGAVQREVEDSMAPTVLTFPRALVTQSVLVRVVTTAGSGPVAISELTLSEPADIFSLKPELKAEIDERIRELDDPTTGPAAADRLTAIGRPAVTWLLVALDDPSALRRAWCVDVLRAIDRGESRATVLAALTRATEGDPQREAVFVRAAFRYLQDRPNRKVGSLALRLYRDDRWRAAAGAELLDAMASSRNTEAVDALRAIVETDAEQRQRAAFGLARAGRPGSRALVSLSSSENPWIRKATAESIRFVNANDPAQQTLIERMTTDPDFVIRATAASSLGDGVLVGQTDRLLEMTRDRHPYVRQAAAHALGAMRRPEARRRLVELTNDEDKLVRTRAVRALVEHGADGIASLTGLVLSPTSDELVGMVDDAIAELAPKFPNEVIELLRPALHDRHHGQRAAHLIAHAGEAGFEVLLEEATTGHNLAAFYAHRGLKGQAQRAAPFVANQLDVPLKTIDASVVSRLLDLLGAAGDSSTTNVLVEASHDPRSRIRADAMRALRSFRSPQTKSLIMEGLADADYNVREQAATIAGEHKLGEAVPRLIELAETGDAVILRAVWALGRIGDRRALDTLHRLLEHHRATVRQYACTALSGIGDATSLPRLVELVDDDDELVRHYALRAIDTIQ